MARFFGKIGFSDTAETKPGVWTSTIIERHYYGDVIRNIRRLQGNQESINSDVTISNEISIVADAYANENFHNIRWVEFMGAKWIVTSVEVQHPRLKLSVGGVYNG